MYKKAITHPTKDNSSIKDEINLVSRLENKTVGSHEVGKRNRLFFPKRHIESPQEYENVLNMTNHQYNASQNHSKYYLIPVRMAITKKTKENKHW